MPPADRRSSRLILATVMTTAALTHVDATMVAIALPRIRQALDAGDGDVHWVVTAYLLAFGLVLLLGGRMGDVLGRRALCLMGQTVFLAGAIAAATAPAVEVLIAARVIQGIGAGLVLPQGAALIQLLFAPKERGRAFAAMGVAISLATTLGPVFSGAFLSAVPGAHSWRWLFIFYVPVSVLVLVLIARLYPGPTRTGGRRTAQLDLVGALLTGTAVSATLYPFLAEAATPLEQRPWLTVPVGLLAAVLLVRHIRTRAARHTPAIIDPALARTPHYAIGAGVGALYFSGFTAVQVVLSLVLQEGAGMSPLAAAALLAPWAVGNGIGAPIGGRAVVRYGRRVVVVGALTSTVAIATVALTVGWAEAAVLPYVLVPAMLLGGIGTGWTIGPNLAVTLQHVHPDRAGGASALIQTGQRLGSALGTGVAVGVLFALLPLGYPGAGASALALCAGMVGLSAAVALVDVLRTWRGGGDLSFD